MSRDEAKDQYDDPVVERNSRLKKEYAKMGLTPDEIRAVLLVERMRKAKPLLSTNDLDEELRELYLSGQSKIIKNVAKEVSHKLR